MLAFVLCAVNGFAQSPVPPAGLAAEAAGEWAQALDVYKKALDREPHDARLWVRVADIEARLGNPEGSASALQHAVQETPRTRRSSTVFHRPMRSSISRWRRSKPSNVRSRCRLIRWTFFAPGGRSPRGSPTTAGHRTPIAACPGCSRRITTLPLNLARVSAWGGRTDAAVEAYSRYLRARAGCGRRLDRAGKNRSVARELRRRPGAPGEVPDSASGRMSAYSREVAAVARAEPAGPAKRSTRSSRSCASIRTTTS